jgi:dimethylglycine dehydrogenase
MVRATTRSWATAGGWKRRSGSRRGEEAQDVVSFHRSNDFEHIGANAGRCARVGITEIANFAKYEITGQGAEAFLSHLMTNTMPKVGRIVLTPMLNEAGKLIGDFTIAKRQAETILHVRGSSAAKSTTCAGSKSTCRMTAGRDHRHRSWLVGLSIAGPKPAMCLRKLTDDDVSNDAFRFMDFREMDVGGAPCMVNRITYTGDLGYEIWMDPEYERQVYRLSRKPARNSASADFGMRALLSMRLEKNFPTWFRELRPIYGPYEAGMDRFVKLSKNDFIGREAAAKEHRRAETDARLLPRRCARRRRDGRRAGLGQGRRHRLRHQWRENAELNQ